jgi:hypothetical protein
MKIGSIGAGQVGGTGKRLLASLRQEIYVAHSRVCAA